VIVAATGLLLLTSCSDGAGDEATSSTRTAPGGDEDQRRRNDPAGIEGVQVVEVASKDHVTERVEYSVDPPAGGPHHPRWVACGVYDEPLPNENAVHSLEHGAVWITHGDIGGDVEVLEELVDVAPGRVLVSPYPALGEGEVVASSWGYQLRVDDADDPRLAAFIELAVDNPEAPEPGASCS
jgi:hypothetical protein